MIDEKPWWVSKRAIRIDRKCKSCGKASQDEHCYYCKEMLGIVPKRHRTSIEVPSPSGKTVLRRRVPII